jgi:hypothetical protein
MRNAKRDRSNYRFDGATVGVGRTRSRRLAFESMEGRLLLSGTDLDTSLFNLDSFAADFANFADFDASRLSGTSGAPPTATPSTPFLMDTSHLLDKSSLDRSLEIDAAFDWPSSVSGLGDTHYTVTVDPFASANAIDPLHGTSIAGLIASERNDFIGSPGVSLWPNGSEVDANVLVANPSTSGGLAGVDRIELGVIRSIDDLAIGAGSKLGSGGRAVVVAVVDNGAGSAHPDLIHRNVVGDAIDVLPLRDDVLIFNHSASVFDVPTLFPGRQEFGSQGEANIAAGRTSGGPAGTDLLTDVAVFESPVIMIESPSTGGDSAIDVAADLPGVDEIALSEGGMISIEALVAAFDEGRAEEIVNPINLTATRRPESIELQLPGYELGTDESKPPIDRSASTVVVGELARAVVFEMLESGADEEVVVVDADNAAAASLADAIAAAIPQVLLASFSGGVGEVSSVAVAAGQASGDVADWLALDGSTAGHGEAFADLVQDESDGRNDASDWSTTVGAAPFLVVIALERVASARSRRDLASAGPPKSVGRNAAQPDRSV